MAGYAALQEMVEDKAVTGSARQYVLEVSPTDEIGRVTTAVYTASPTATADSEVEGSARLGRPRDRRSRFPAGSHEQVPEVVRQHVSKAPAANGESAVFQDSRDVKPVAGAGQRDIHEPLGFLSLAETLLLVAVGDERPH